MAMSNGGSVLEWCFLVGSIIEGQNSTAVDHLIAVSLSFSNGVRTSPYLTCEPANSQDAFIDIGKSLFGLLYPVCA
jgi:hypothetical protein